MFIQHFTVSSTVVLKSQYSLVSIRQMSLGPLQLPSVMEVAYYNRETVWLWLPLTGKEEESKYIEKKLLFIFVGWDYFLDNN